MRRGVVIAQDSGNRFNESHLVATLARLEAQHGDPLAALEYSAVAIRHLHDSGNSPTIRGPLAILAVFLDRLGRYEPAATIAGFASTPMTAIGFRELSTAITHLRDVLGDQTYESLARTGETMSTAAMATYTYDQIDQAPSRIEICLGIELESTSATLIEPLARRVIPHVAMSHKLVPQPHVSSSTLE